MSQSAIAENSIAGTQAEQALDLLTELQDRVGPLSYLEWGLLNTHSEFSAAEFSVVEAEVLVRLARFNGSQNGSVQLRSPIEWLEKDLKTCRYELTVPVKNWPIDPFAIVVLIAGAQSAIPPVVFGRFGESLFLVVGGSLFAVASMLIHRQRITALRTVEEQLAKSNIVERLVENDPTLNDIHRYTPVPFNWAVFGLGKHSLEDRLELVAKHLDWFLRSHARYLRVHWVFRLRYALGVPLMLSSLLPSIAGGTFFMGLWLLMNGGKTGLERYFTASLIEHLIQRVEQRQATAHSSAPPLIMLP